MPAGFKHFIEAVFRSIDVDGKWISVIADDSNILLSFLSPTLISSPFTRRDSECDFAVLCGLHSNFIAKLKIRPQLKSGS